MMKVIIRCAKGVLILMLLLPLIPILAAGDAGGGDDDNGPPPISVPEPATLILLGSGLASLAGYSLYKKRGK